MRNTLILTSILLVAIAAYFLFVFESGNTSLDQKEIAFSIEDTAAVQRIVLIQVVNGRDEERLVLDREGKGWRLNQQYIAFQPRVNNLLRTMHLIHIKDKLVDKGVETALKLFDLKHTRVEAFSGSKLIKSYLVGTEYRGSIGTVMMLEDAEQPFIVELPGLQGYVNPHYTLDQTVWRENLLFNGTLSQIREISISYTDAPNQTYSLKRDAADADWKLQPGDTSPGKVSLETYLEQFEGKVYAESFAEGNYPGLYDELAKITPDIRFKVAYFSGETRSFVLYDREDNVNSYFGWIEGKNELLTIQHFVVDKFLETHATFSSQATTFITQ